MITSLLAGSFAQEDASTTTGHIYDAENAIEINELCAGCHGEFGEGGSGGEYPRLAGLPAEYLAKELRKFKSRERHSISMATYATERELPESDLLDISIFLSELDLMSRLPILDPNMSALEKLRAGQRVFNVPRYEGDIIRGEKTYARKCRRCHGKEGKGHGDTPPLTGQYTEYLRIQIRHFQSGARQNKRMEKYLRHLSQRKIEDLLAYLSVADD